MHGDNSPTVFDPEPHLLRKASYVLRNLYSFSRLV